MSILYWCQYFYLDLADCALFCQVDAISARLGEIFVVLKLQLCLFILRLIKLLILKCQESFLRFEPANVFCMNVLTV